jgi:hypothetical protein
MYLYPKLCFTKRASQIHATHRMSSDLLSFYTGGRMAQQVGEDILLAILLKIVVVLL